MRGGAVRRVSALILVGTAVIAVSRSAGAALPLGPASFVQTWSAGPFNEDLGGPIALSSPMVATLDSSGPSAVVGDRAGFLYAYHLSDGTVPAGWPAYAGVPIDSTPSVAPFGPGGTDVVYVGAGNAQYPDNGAYDAFGPAGNLIWSTRVTDPPGDTAPAEAVQASLTVTGLRGRPAVFAGSLDQESYALSATSGAVLPGWPWFSADSVFSTAAAADLYGNGQTELVDGGAATAGYAYGQSYPQGGHLRILSATGGLICHYDTNQEVDSSPAVGAFLPGRATGIVVGTGSFYPGTSDTDTLKAFNNDCGLVWSDTLDGVTGSSPALADIFGNGQLEAVEGTDTGSGGSVWVVDAATGTVLWTKPAVDRVIGSVVTADLSGDGHQDLLVPTIHGVEVMDGRTGSEITVLAGTEGFQNSPLVTDDPDGSAGITIAGYNGNNQGVIYHYELPGSNGALAAGAGSWPMFHHDPQLTGVERPPYLQAESSCVAPAPASDGYNLVASDGGVFSFGEPFCGSTANMGLRQPVIGAAMSPAGGGYWLVTAAGGVFTFGAAQFYGSTAAMHLHSTVVGVAATPDGKGYWLVTKAGGIFSFGDAQFYGSLAGTKLPAPVVGIASNSDGMGYRLVTSNGDVYSFGDAPYFGGVGSVHLFHPIVGIASDWATGGYWLVASDGGVFSFNAPYLGSTGGIRLIRPVVQLEATEDGNGYWLVGSDGGVFSFGDATFHGSTGGIRLARPVVALVGFSG